VNAYIVEAKVRRAMSQLRRARARAIASIAAAIVFGLAAIAGAAVSVSTGADGPVALGLAATVAAICFAVWGGSAMRAVARWERRIVEDVAAAADRAAPRPRAA
jgi:hypothetical protein